LYLYDFYYPFGECEHHDKFHKRILGLIEEYLDFKSLARGVQRKYGWKHKIVITTELQQDGYNCGPLVCLVGWMTVWLRRPPTYDEMNEIDFKGEELRNMRSWMAYSALTDRIWLPPVAETTTDAVRVTYDGFWGASVE
jgi:hypothetical protein